METAHQLDAHGKSDATRARRARWALPVSLAAFLAVALAADPALTRGPPRRGPLEQPELGEVTRLLREFQRHWADLYAAGGAPMLLEQIPGTVAVRHQLFRDVGFLSDMGLVLVQDLATFEVRSLERTGPRSAEAVVAEEWNYMYRRFPSREPVTSLRGMGRAFRYDLQKRPDGRWIVAGWRSEPSARVEPISGFTW